MLLKKTGRPKLSKLKKRTHEVRFYLNDLELENSKRLEALLSSSSPALSSKDFFRFIINNFNDDLFKSLGIEFNDPISTALLKSKRSYNKNNNKD